MCAIGAQSRIIHMLSFEVDERITTIHTVWDHLQCCQTPLAFVQNPVHFSRNRMHLYYISPLCGFGKMDQNRNHLVGRPTISRYALICPVWIEGVLLLKGSYVTARLQLTNVCDILTVTFLHWDSVCSANSLPLNWLLRSSVAECFVDESLSSANAASAGARSRMSAHPQVKSWNEEKHEVQKNIGQSSRDVSPQTSKIKILSCPWQCVSSARGSYSCIVVAV